MNYSCGAESHAEHDPLNSVISKAMVMCTLCDDDGSKRVTFTCEIVKKYFASRKFHPLAHIMA